MSAGILQFGRLTPTHAVVAVTDGVVADAGPAGASQITSFGVTANGFNTMTVASGLPGSAYAVMGLGVSLGNAAQISVTSYSGAAALPLQIVVNGATLMTINNDTITIGAAGVTTNIVGTLDVNGVPPFTTGNYVAWLNSLPTAPVTTGPIVWNNRGIATYS